jgi:hypothetical protein
MNPRVSRALGSSWRFLSRIARYFGPLLRDTGAYLARLSLDMIGGMRVLFLSWRTRRNPARSAAYLERRQALRARRTERWIPWRALTATRRLEIRAAGAAVLLIVWVTARASWGPPQPEVLVPPDAANAGAAAVEAPSDTAAATAPPVVPVIDVRQVVATFAADRRRLLPGGWTELRDVPVLERGALGAWDDQLVAVPVVLKETGTTPSYRMWFRGCHMAMREFSCGVGHARSSDGVVWEKTPSPVFVPQDPSLQESLYQIAVVKTGGRYYLWYSVMADYFQERRRAALYLATSVDGLTFKDEGQVLEAASDNPPMIAHAVLHDGQRFHLWYVTSEKGEGLLPDRILQHQSSPDGKVWTTIGNTSLRDAFDTTLTPDLGHLTVDALPGGGFRAYLYDSVARVLTSVDGTTWTKGEADLGPLKAWSKQRVEVHSLSGLRDDEGLWLWMDVRSMPNDMRVAVVFQKGS